MNRLKCSLFALRYSLGIVILIEAILFVMPAARHDFARTHMPDMVRQILGWGEIVGAVLLLIPPTAVRGAWLLAGIFVLAIAIHLLHGFYNVGNLVIYAAAAWAIAESR
ncbi:MAG TPA: DoxX family protein [Candidatus Binatia bacterium]|nr:DoxX family protein [Candidatus Binatia bacterium]